MTELHYSPISEYELPVLENLFHTSPAKDAINDAKEKVMTIILEDFPQSGGRVILRASEVAERLRERGHTLAASLFAIRECIFAHKLFVLPTIPPDNSAWSPWNDVNLFVSAEWPVATGRTAALRSGTCGLTVDNSERKVWRQGYPNHLEFDGKSVTWFIFKTIFDANGGEINMHRFEQAYNSKGSWEARFTAINDLNKHLRELGVKITKWKLHDL